MGDTRGRDRAARTALRGAGRPPHCVRPTDISVPRDERSSPILERARRSLVRSAVRCPCKDTAAPPKRWPAMPCSGSACIAQGRGPAPNSHWVPDISSIHRPFESGSSAFDRPTAGPAIALASIAFGGGKGTGKDRAQGAELPRTHSSVHNTSFFAHEWVKMSTFGCEARRRTILRASHSIGHETSSACRRKAIARSEAASSQTTTSPYISPPTSALV
jgi:hypothetical protein